MNLIAAAAERMAAEEIAESDFGGEMPWLTPREKKKGVFLQVILRRMRENLLYLQADPSSIGEF